MNLTNMANFVCSKVGRTDSESIASCQGFIGRRYELIYDSQLWRDTLQSSTITVSSGTQDVTLPTSIDRIIAVRWSDRALTPVQQEAVYYIDPTLFDKSGTPLSFVIMPRTSSGQSVIRLVQKPATQKDVTVLGKSGVRVIDSSNLFQTRTLTQGGDSPVLRGIDHGLLAYAEGDMLTRERQYGKAQLMYAEASSTLRIAFNLERGQEASEIQISPSDSGGWDRSDWEMTGGMTKSEGI